MNDNSQSSRRSFLSSVSRWLLGAIALLLAWGIGRFTVFETIRIDRKPFARAVLNDLEPGIPLHVPDAGAWLFKRGRNDEPIAFDDRCTHLGCRAKWDEKQRVLRCPCHGSEFGADGSVRRGPARKSLRPLFFSHTKGTMVRLLDEPLKRASQT